MKKECMFTSQNNNNNNLNNTKMAAYNKTIELNGKKIIVNVNFDYDYLSTYTTSDRMKKTSKRLVNVWINNVCYKNAVTSIYNVSNKTGRYSASFVCNKTGAKFNDSEKKVVEHILTLNQ